MCSVYLCTLNELDNVHLYREVLLVAIDVHKWVLEDNIKGM